MSMGVGDVRGESAVVREFAVRLDRGCYSVTRAIGTRCEKICLNKCPLALVLAHFGVIVCPKGKSAGTQGKAPFTKGRCNLLISLT